MLIQRAEWRKGWSVTINAVLRHLCKSGVSGRQTVCRFRLSVETDDANYSLLFIAAAVKTEVGLQLVCARLHGGVCVCVGGGGGVQWFG